MDAQSNRNARTAAIAGTRELVHSTSFDALVSLLVLTGAVPREKARGMLDSLADQLDGYREAGHGEFQVCAPELSLHADRLRKQAEMMV